MSSIVDVLSNLANQTGFASLDWKNYVMILVAFVFMFLAIKFGFEPLLLVPISFGMLLVNMFPDIMAEGGLLHQRRRQDHEGVYRRSARAAVENQHHALFLRHCGRDRQCENHRRAPGRRAGAGRDERGREHRRRSRFRRL